MPNQDFNLDSLPLEQQVALLTQKVQQLQATVQANAGNPNLPIAGNYNVYVGARYVPKFAEPTEWSATVHYEPLTIVTYQGNSYTTKTFPPVGVEPTNETYWVQTGNYNAQVNLYRQEVQSVLNNQTKMNEDIQDNTSDISNIKNQLTNVTSDITSINTRLKNNIIWIGDSYSTGNAPSGGVATNSFPKITSNILGLTLGTDYFLSAMDGASWIGTGSKSYLQLLQDIAPTITNKNLITDIIVTGGCNDVNNSIANQLSAMSAFSLYAKQTFPNATIHIAMIGAFNLGNRYFDLWRFAGIAYNRCGQYGMKAIQGVWNVMKNSSYFQIDNVHPNQDGQNALGYAFADYMANPHGSDIAMYMDAIHPYTLTLNPDIFVTTTREIFQYVYPYGAYLQMSQLNLETVAGNSIGNNAIITVGTLSDSIINSGNEQVGSMPLVGYIQTRTSPQTVLPVIGKVWIIDKTVYARFVTNLDKVNDIQYLTIVKAGGYLPLGAY